MTARRRLSAARIAPHRSTILRLVLVACLGFSCFTPSLAQGQPNPREKAAAEAAFQHAVTLFEQHRVREACEQFEASYALDRALGTQLRLADCYDRAGRTASAWALFVEARDVARQQGQIERQNIADTRAKDLEQRLAKLTLRVQPGPRPKDFSIRVNGLAIPPGSWGLPIPVDPGLQQIEASARGYQTWSASFVANSGPSEGSVTVPTLDRVAGSDEVVTAPSANQNATENGARGVPRSTYAYVTGAAGVLGLGLTMYFGYRAHGLNDDSLDYCRQENANACLLRGKEIRDDARRAATISTISGIATVALLGTSAVLFLTEPPQKARHGVQRIQLRAVGSQHAAGIALEGQWL